MGFNHSLYRTICLALCFLMLFAIFGGAVQAVTDHLNVAEQPDLKIEQEVLEALQTNSFVDVIIELTEQADTLQLVQSLELSTRQYFSAEAKKRVKRQAVVHALQQTAEKTQPIIIKMLERYQKQGQVKDYRSFYVINAVYAQASKEAIVAIARLPQVTRIALDEKIELQLATSTVTTTHYNSSKVEWNLKRIQVDQVWNQLGIRGEGVVVGLIDTGVFWQHDALKTKWRGYNPDQPYNSNPYGNWFDAISGRTMPYDEELNPHGTSVLGLVLGEVPGHHPIGVAPDAQWIAARAFTEEGGRSSWILAAGEFMLAPGGNPALAPDIVVNAWGGTPEKNDWFRQVVQAWRDAGILPVFAAGNSPQGAAAGSVSNPANYPESVAVGAVDKDNRRAYFSNKGPSAYADAGYKPDLVAPGVNIWSIVPGGYAQLSGTSMAAPQVAGVAALLKSVDSALSVEQIEDTLNGTALPLTDQIYPSAPNHGYGHGLIQAYSAVQHLLQDQIQPEIKRLEGSDRYLTAVAVSQYGWESAPVVFITRGDDFADALASIPLAAQYEAPILLTRPHQLPAAVKEEMRRLQASKVIIIGGVEAVSYGVQKDLEDLVQSVERIGGSNRYDTAALIANRLDSNPSTAVVINGRAFADALSVAAYAAREGMPILLTDVNRLPKETQVVLRELNIDSPIVIGGAQVISDTVFHELGAQKRLAGANRYETNIMVNRHFKPSSGTLLVATGRTFPDALSGAALAARINSGILLADQELKPLTKEYLQDNVFSQLIILGGEAAVPGRLVRQLK